jgi:nitrogen-specific signal transduction histidine kinase
MLSAVMLSVDKLQGTLSANDLLEQSFNLVNDGCLFVNSHLEVIKANKSVQIILNSTSQFLIGKQLSEALGSQNSHLMLTV